MTSPKKTTIKRFIFLCLFWGISFFMNSIYRPYIYENKIHDFGIADIGNNLFFVPGTSLALSLSSKNIKTYEDNKKWIIVNFFTLATIEIASLKFPIFGHYDFKDIIGLFIGMLLALKINQYIEGKKTII